MRIEAGGNNNVLDFFAEPYTIFCHAEPVEGSQSYSAVAILNLLEESTFFLLWSEILHSVQEDNLGGFVKCVLILSRDLN